MDLHDQTLGLNLIPTRVGKRCEKAARPPSSGSQPRLLEDERVVARAGIEPATFRFSGERCYQLSYLAKPISDPDGTRTRDLRRDRAAR